MSESTRERVVTPQSDRLIAVTGVTGNQGGAAARSLLQRGFRVRGLTRDASSPSAKRMAERGVELVQGDMSDAAAVGTLMTGAHGAYVVTDFFRNGLVREVSQGRLLAESAKSAGVAHYVFASIGFAERHTGVPYFEAKWAIEQRIAELQLPATILRPSMFMEDLVEMKYGAPVWWGSFRRIVGRDKRLGWISVHDVGEIAAAVLSDSDRFIGEQLMLIGDVRTLREAQAIFRRVDGKAPLAIPLPLFLVRRLVNADIVPMWTWMGRNAFELDPAPTRKILPTCEAMETWLRRFRAEH